MKVDITKKFESIYSLESDAVFRFCFTRVSDREKALDITQETFLRLWQSLQEGKEIWNDRAFLFTVARRLVIDWYRKKKSLSLDDMMTSDEDEGYQVIDADTTKVNLELASEGRFLLEKINELSPAHREVIYMRYIEDMSPGDIGEVLGISANTASVRISRGLVELREKTGYNVEGDQ